MSSKLNEQAEELQRLIDELKTGKLDHAQFFRQTIQILNQMEVDQKLLEGVIPYLVSCVNNMIRNNS
ncbi:MAG: hypothetical protein C6I01_02820 [Epsilonproteobacteria bacterium]|nr:hypothetical protein [Campylobacterota bacterium]NPA89589.1 hypothetical protein [Campylobacterota bacterium]